MEKILIYSDNLQVAKELLTAARLLGEPTALSLDAEAANELVACGAQVLLFENSNILAADTAAISQVVTLAVRQAHASVVLIGSDRRGKELAGRLGEQLDAGCLTDVKSINLEGDQVMYSRLAYGGATVTTETIVSDKKVIAISPATFEKAQQTDGGSLSSLIGDVKASVTLLGSRAKKGDSVDLKAEEIIVAVGQGVADEVIEDASSLAKALGGALACSKPVATDRKLLGEERVIGLSGSLCKPSLALLIGISGQVQFAVGIRDAKTIITINTDENADMARMSDYYCVMDSQAAIAELSAALNETEY